MDREKDGSKKPGKCVCTPDDSTYMLPAAIHLLIRSSPSNSKQATSTMCIFPVELTKNNEEEKSAQFFVSIRGTKMKIRSRLRLRWSDWRTAEVACASMYARHFSYLFMFSFASSSHVRPSSFPSNHILFHRTRVFCINFVELASRDEKSIGL